MHSTGKAHSTTLDDKSTLQYVNDEKYDVHYTRCDRMSDLVTAYIVWFVYANQPEAFALDLSDDLSC